MSISKPCFFCGDPVPVVFDHVALFDAWSSANRILCDSRSRFDGVRERLAWAAKDEANTGAHPLCALRWAIEEEDYSERYGIMPEMLS